MLNEYLDRRYTYHQNKSMLNKVNIGYAIKIGLVVFAFTYMQSMPLAVADPLEPAEPFEVYEVNTKLLDETKPAEGSKEDSTEDTDVPFLSPESLDWIDTTHQEWSLGVASVGSYLDGLIDDTTELQNTNRSYIKIYLDADVSKYDSLEFDQSIKFRLDLPLAKKKLRLVIESEPDQGQSLEERNLSQLPSTTSADDDGLYGSFRWLVDSSRWKRLSFDTGVKAKFPPDPFTRARAVREWEITSYWDMVFSQEVFWFESKGLGTFTEFNFNRPLSEKLTFQVSNVLDWSERDELFELLEQLSLFQTIDTKRTVQYSVGFTGEHKNRNARTTNYFTKATYRRRLYKHWLFYELTPGIEFPRDEDFNGNPFLSFRLEILFSADIDQKLSAKKH